MLQTTSVRPKLAAHLKTLETSFLEEIGCFSRSRVPFLKTLSFFEGLSEPGKKSTSLVNI